MSLTYQNLVGTIPHPKALAFLAFWKTYVSRRMPQVTTTGMTLTYFAQAGNDITGDGSIATPYKTIVKAQAVHDASGSTANLILLFKRGDTWIENQTLAVTKNNVGIMGYGDEKDLPPIFSQFRVGFTWANTSGNVYECLPGSAVYWAQEDQSLYQPYSKQDSIVHVQANAGSWWYDSGTGKVYVQTRGGGAPTAGTFGLVTWSNNVLFTTCDGCFIQGVRFFGYAANGLSDGKYPIKAVLSGTKCLVIDSCEVYYTPNATHSIGMVDDGNVGGIVFVNRCRVGLCTYAAHIFFVGFNGVGSQEFVINDCEIIGGMLPQVGVSTNVVAFYGHTGSGTAALTASIGLKIRSSTLPVYEGGQWNNLPDPGTDITLARGFEIGTIAESGSLTFGELSIASGVVVNRNQTVQPTASAVTLNGPYNKSWAINDCLIIDWQKNPNAGYAFGYNNSSTSLIREYCQIHHVNAGTQASQVNLSNSGGNTGVFRNCVFSQDGSVAQMILNMGSSFLLDNNIYNLVYRTGSSGADYQNDALAITTSPGIVSRLNTPASNSGFNANVINETNPLQYDLFGNRRSSTPSVGPSESSPIFIPSTSLRNRWRPGLST